MSVLAVQVVHTTGINWLGLGAQIMAIAVPLAAFIGFVLRRAERRRAEHEKWVTATITAAVTAVSRDFGDQMSGLAAQLGGLSDQVEHVSRRTWRIETKLMRRGVLTQTGPGPARPGEAGTGAEARGTLVAG